MKYPLIAILLLLCAIVRAQDWSGPVRGSWVRTGPAQAGDVTLADAKGVCEIVVAPLERSAVQQAAKFLAGDIERLCGNRPAILARATGKRPAIILSTLDNSVAAAGIAAAGIAADRLRGQWEAYQVLTGPASVNLVGSNFRGTAFAAYTLSERLGIDPLYLWTGYTPKQSATLILKATDAFFGPPTFKYRGLFHDDEDILPRPFDPRNGYPYVRGTVPTIWYQRFFETALRLRMNQVAPFVRVNRPDEVRKLASDWGLFYTSHHYDILLSNPYGYTNFGLAKKRGVEGPYDYYTNREGMRKFWRGGVEENKNLDVIWPVGLRGTDDAPHRFPEGTTEDQKLRLFEEAIRDQVAMVKQALPPGSSPVFHFTMYNEMLDAYRSGKLHIPEDVLIIWDDNGDGIMRGLPENRGVWKHGVYYHLAFFGATAKQSVHTVTPMRVAAEFRKIVDAGATEYVLVNVSELREHVMEARMIAEIAWDAKTALAGEDPAARYVDWWSREYFGEAAAPLAADAYRRYYQINDEQNKIWYASVKVRDALGSLMKKVNGESFDPVLPETRETLPKRLAMHEAARSVVEQAMAKMSPEQAQFFFEHVWLGLAIDYYPTLAALDLIAALDEKDNELAFIKASDALLPLTQMEADIKRAERTPFEDWYRPTWIRVADFFNGWSDMNVHRPYDMVRLFLEGRTRSALSPDGEEGSSAAGSAATGRAASKSEGAHPEKITMAAANVAPADDREGERKDVRLERKEARKMDVAAIYFPSYHVDDHYSTWFGENWNEWKLVDAAKPRFPGHRLNKPAWGYFDEADPKWMERQIDAAADHGINVFIFDWYWYSGVQILHRPVEEALPKARNRNRMKYALMWADHTWTNFFPAPYNKPYHWLLPIRHSPADFTRVMDHCIRHHFNQPNYWKVDGGAYFSIFAPEDFIRQLGGPEKTKAVLEAARKQVAKAGLGTVHFAAFTGIPESAKLCEEAGFDSLTSYNVTTMSAPLRLPEQPFEEYDAFAARHPPYWEAMDKSTLPYCPVVTAGWDVSFRWSDDTPWPPAVNNYPYTPIVVNNTPEKFQALCSQARAWVERNPKHPPAVFINSWNEWTEGGAIMPGTSYGNGYLDAVQAAFALR